jgi:hypothetical protein
MDYTETKSIWYTKSKMWQFKHDAGRDALEIIQTKAAAKAYISTSLEKEGSLLIFRGVEYIYGIKHMLSQGINKLLLACRMLTVKRVLQEQDYQRKMGEINLMMNNLLSSS